MLIKKILKVSLSAILSLAILASVIIMPTVVSADTIAVSEENLIVNGSFENDLTDGWNQFTWEGFYSVNASDENITAVDGSKVLKIENVNAWNYRTQTITVEANTDYEFSFWVYRVDDSSNSVYKLGNSTKDTAYNSNGSQTWLNDWIVTGKWVKIRRTFNSGSDTTVKVTFCTQNTTSLTYIDKIEVKPLINYIPNDSFEEDFTHWSKAGTGQSVVKASDESLTAVNGEKILKMDINSGSQWAYVNQTLTLEANTDYIFSTWVYQPDSSSALILKTGNSSSDTALCPGGVEYLIWANNKIYGKWVKVSYSFNTGSDTKFKLYFVISAGTTYVDDVKLQKKINVTATATEGGTVSGLPTYVGSGDDITLTATAKKGYTFDGWYKGEEKLTDSNYYTFTAKEVTDYTAKFIADPAIISDGGFEDDVLNAGWDNGYGALSLVTDQVYEGEHSVLIKPIGAYHNVRWDLTLEANKYYVVRFAVMRVGSSKAWIKVTPSSNTSTNLLEGSPANGNYEIGEGTGWTTKAFYFNTGDNTSFNLFFVGENTNVATYIDNLVIEEVGAQVVNGSFEEHYDNGWITGYHSNFSVVNASEVAPGKAINGSKVLKTTAESDAWRTLIQRVKLEANTEYVVSFWYYRENSGYISLKFGNSTADNGLVKESWLNNDAQNKWIYKQWNITTTDDTILKMFIAAFNGTAYVDNICVTKADAIGNLIQNGNMTDAGIGINGFKNNNSALFTYESETEGYTDNGVFKVTGDNNSATWYNMSYTVKVKANTDYVFRFYAKNEVAGVKTLYKVLNASNKSLINGDKWTNGDGEDGLGNGSGWGKNEWRINSGENTTIQIQFVERVDAVTYIDDVYFGEAIETTVDTTKKELGNYIASKTYVGEDDEVAYTAYATEGGIFLGWRLGDSETLIEEEIYTYKGFEDINLTAVFAAKIGNINEDEAINITDLATLRGLFLNDEELPELGDMDGNGTIDARDLVALKKLIAGA